MKRLLTLCITAFILVWDVNSQGGQLDPDFGTGGWLHTDFGGKDQANAVGIQADGKILVGGQTNVSGGFDWALIRYLSNGDPDPDFGTAGKMTWDFGSAQENIEFVYVLNDQKIVVGGWSNSSPNSMATVIRLNSDGSPDESFGDKGILQYRFGRSTGPIAMAVQDDGKYLISGIAVIDSFDVDWLVARFYPDGKLDSSFNKTGYNHYKFFTRENIPFSIIIQEDKKIFMTGCAGVTNKTNFAFLRLHEDGTPDDSFGNGGGLQTDFKNGQDVAFTSIILEDGKIMVSGMARDSITNLDIALARYLPDGTLDPSFGVDGKITHDLKGPLDNGLYMFRQPDGKFLVCGTNNVIGHNSYVVVRFNPDGSIDPTFGKNGVASLDVISILPDNTPGFAMQADGKLVLVHNYKDGTNVNFLAMRFTNDIRIKNDDVTPASDLIKVHPNPASDIIYISINEQLSNSELKIEIMNSQAQVVDQKVLHARDLNKSSIPYSLKNITPGVYFLKWTSDENTGVIPVVRK
jgi:uncharacterized delta-60 repeat protein